MPDESRKASYLARLLALFQESPAPERVRASLDQAQAATWLHTKDLPLPPDPRLVLGGARRPADSLRVRGGPGIHVAQPPARPRSSVPHQAMPPVETVLTE
jgi:hypothetical protein